MKREADPKIKHGSCCPQMETKPAEAIKALSMLNQLSTISNAHHSSPIILGNEERKAIEAYILDVDVRRSMAIEHMRRNMIR